MPYAADIFLTPHTRVGRRWGNTKYTQAIVKKLASIQRGAALLITGALRSTATDAVETLVGLLPFHLLIDKVRYSAAIWLATIPSTHLLHKLVNDAASRLVKQHPTPLHDLMHRYSIQPATMEKITLRRFHADWKPRHIIQIIKDRKLAIRLIAHDNPNLKIFTDSSGINDKIRASAVLYRNNRKKATLHYELGPTSHHTVMKARPAACSLPQKLLWTKLMSTQSSSTLTTGQQSSPQHSPNPHWDITSLTPFTTQLAQSKRKTPACPSNSSGYPLTEVLKGMRQLTKLPKKPPPMAAHTLLNYLSY